MRLAALLLLSPCAASAADHSNRIVEVLLADESGDAAVQYVELLDRFDEPFPNGPYRLAVFDASGQDVGSVALDYPASFTVDVPYLVSTPAADAAFGATATTTLDVALPAAGGACFVRADGIEIDCVSWGCRTEGSGEYPAAPPDGRALSQGTDELEYADPTPGAANVAGDATTPAECGGEEPTTGGGCCSVAGREGGSPGVGLLLVAIAILVGLRRRASPVSMDPSRAMLLSCFARPWATRGRAWSRGGRPSPP